MEYDIEIDLEKEFNGRLKQLTQRKKEAYAFLEASDAFMSFSEICRRSGISQSTLINLRYFLDCYHKLATITIGDRIYFCLASRKDSISKVVLNNGGEAIEFPKSVLKKLLEK